MYNLLNVCIQNSYLNMAHRLKQLYCFSFAAKPPPPPRKCVIYFSYNSSYYYYSLSSRHAFDYFDSVVTFKMEFGLGSGQSLLP